MFHGCVSVNCCQRHESKFSRQGYIMYTGSMVTTLTDNFKINYCQKEKTQKGEGGVKFELIELRRHLNSIRFFIRTFSGGPTFQFCLLHHSILGPGIEPGTIPWSLTYTLSSYHQSLHVLLTKVAIFIL